MRALVGGNLIDGTGSPPVADAAVLVSDDGRIEGVGKRGDVSLPPGTEVTQIDGMTLLPGLIDCHDHLAFHDYSVMARWGFNEPQSTYHVRTAKVLEQTLLSGYTAVRDAGYLDVGFKMAIEEGLIPGPRLIIATSPMSGTGGVADLCSPSGHHWPPQSNPNLPWAVVDGVDQVRATVRELARVGADVIKYFSTGGASARPGFGPKDYIFGRDEIQALVDEAHALGRRAMCHALGGPGLRMAVEAGTDSIEHGAYLDEEPDLIKMMADKGTFFVPTFAVYTYHGSQGTPHGQARVRDLWPHLVESMNKALAAGVKVVAGCDAGGWGHANNAQEITLLVQSGMTPMQALVAATGWAAECLGLEKEIGTVQRGKLADLVVVDGDPLADITVLQDKYKIKLVMKGGEVYANKLQKERVSALRE